VVEVLHLVASSRGGGASHVRDLAIGLDRLRLSVLVAMPEDDGNVTPQDFQSAGIPFYALGIAAGFSWRALRRVRGLLHCVDILHVHGARAALFGRLAAASLGRRRPRVVYTIHGFAATHYRLPRRTALLALERALAHSTDRWICVSHAEQEALLAAGAAEPGRTCVIWNGIDLQRFTGAMEARSTVRSALNVPDDAFVVSTVCRLHRPRDFDTLLQAFASVRETLPHAHLVIAGDGPLRPWIEGRASSLGLQKHVRFLGSRRDVPRILRASDVFVLSSKGWEGLPLTVLEAMAAAVPVVASDVGGTREAVVDGQTGYLYPAGVPAALAQHIRALASDPTLAQQMGKRGLSRVREHFALERMAEQTAALYEQLLTGTQVATSH
jgi:glycosyltransferase involved in cell wall biosynthesis